MTLRERLQIVGWHLRREWRVLAALAAIGILVGLFVGLYRDCAVWGREYGLVRTNPGPKGYVARMEWHDVCVERK